MSDIFHRQLASYAQYHRDPHNCATHFVGIPMLFLAVILPLQALPVRIGQHEVPLAIVLSLPAIVGWLWLDLRLGAALLLLLCPLFIAAALIVRHGHVLTWCSAAVLFVVGWAFQLVGHAVFECLRRRRIVRPDRPDVCRGQIAGVAGLAGRPRAPSRRAPARGGAAARVRLGQVTMSFRGALLRTTSDISAPARS